MQTRREGGGVHGETKDKVRETKVNSAIKGTFVVSVLCQLAPISSREPAQPAALFAPHLVSGPLFFQGNSEAWGELCNHVTSKFKMAALRRLERTFAIFPKLP